MKSKICLKSLGSGRNHKKSGAQNAPDFLLRNIYEGKKERNHSAPFLKIIIRTAKPQWLSRSQQPQQSPAVRSRSSRQRAVGCSRPICRRNGEICGRDAWDREGRVRPYRDRPFHRAGRRGLPYRRVGRRVHPFHRVRRRDVLQDRAYYIPPLRYYFP